jgi:hypothetical protein
MIRLGISVEGASEREFVSRILAPHLASFGVTAVGVDIRGHVSLDRVRNTLPRLLGDFQFVSTLYDYYAFARRGELDADGLEAAIAAMVDGQQRIRLLPYIQRYEFEALLFAVPEHTVKWLGASVETLAAMRQAVQQCGSPERINDSPQTSPSHRIRSLFPNYRKTLHGTDVIELAGLAAIRQHCPRFDAWVTALEHLGTAA